MAVLARSPVTRAHGFTLLELLVVLVILAVLAAVVVPQLYASLDDSRLAALDGNLAVLRGAVERYRHDHGVYPGARASSGGTCSGRGGTGTVADATGRAATLAEQLTFYSNNAGKVCSLASASFRFGPYLKTAGLGAAGMPVNPLTGSNAVRVVSSGNLGLVSTSSNGGWLYDTVSGRLLADHQDYDDR